MTDVVITAGGAIGSVITLAKEIRSNIECKVYILSHDEPSIKTLLSSKYITDVQLLDVTNEHDYIENIKKWYISKQFAKPPIMYFATDTSCFYVNNNREWFEKHFLLCLPSSDIVETYTQKGLAEPAAYNSGLNIPRTIVINNIENVKHVMENFNFPVILKPLATYLKKDLDFKIKVIDRPEDFALITDKYLKINSFICQEFIPDDIDSAYYYIFYRSQDGNINESMGIKTLQSTTSGGIMLKGISKFDKQLSTLCRNFLKEINYIGIGGIEFKKFNGRFYFIEMSVRLEGFYRVSEATKVPLSLISYYDLTNNSKINLLRDKTQEDDKVYIDLLFTTLNRLKSKKYKLLFNDIFQLVFNKNITTNVLDTSDIKPFFMQTINFMKRKKK